MKTSAHYLIALLLVGAITSCSKTELQNMDPKTTVVEHREQPVSTQGPGLLTKLQTQLTYFDWHTYNIQLTKIIDEPVVFLLPDRSEPANLYVYDAGIQPGPNNQPYLPVSSVNVTSSGKTVLREMVIQFNSGINPHQFYSEEDIMASVNGVHPLITVHATGRVYEAALFNPAPQPFVRPSRQ